jgi:hypothetical protein
MQLHHRLVLLVAAAATLPGTTLAGDVIVEATGTVVQANPSASSPFLGTQPGDPVVVHIEVFVPGMDIVPGQLTQYTIDTAASFVRVGGVSDTFLSGAVAIQNDFPVADGIRVPNAPLTGGGGLGFEVSESSGTLFTSTDIAMQLGAWGPSTWSSINFGVFGGGSFIEFSSPDVTISLPMIGTNYCQAVPNSTGAVGVMGALGSLSLAANDFTLVASSLPPNQFGIFVTSMTQGFAPGASGTSNGNLCLAGSIGRFSFPGQILNAGPTGSYSLGVSAMALPQGSGTVSALAGETWSFQSWHRDGVGLGSNFTDGLEVTWQ